MPRKTKKQKRMGDERRNLYALPGTQQLGTQQKLSKKESLESRTYTPTDSDKQVHFHTTRNLKKSVFLTVFLLLLEFLVFFATLYV